MLRQETKSTTRFRNFKLSVGMFAKNFFAKKAKSSEEPKQTKKCIIRYHASWKFKWDVFMMFILIIIAILVPVRLAFAENDSGFWLYFNYCIDFLFFIDLILTFFTTYFDEKLLNEVTDMKLIAKNYLRTWFVIDFLSIFPFEPVLQGLSIEDVGAFVQITRVTKLYKLVRMVRLLKMARIFKDRRKIVMNLDKVMRISAGLERLTFFCLVYLMFCHIITCLWIFVASFEDEMNWLIKMFGEDWRNELSPLGIYNTSLYFVLTTITTVGYGDITATNMHERVFCYFLMMVGVIGFSFTSGQLSSLISSVDSNAAKMSGRMLVLTKIKKQYKISKRLTEKLEVAIKFEHSKNIEGLSEFMDELPQKLQVELAAELHKDITDQFDFF